MIGFGICLQSLIPLRSEPSHRSEMVTQVLFGELYRIVYTNGLWIRIQLVFDNYEGWIPVLQSRSIRQSEFLRLGSQEPAIVAELVQLVSDKARTIMIPVVLGSSLPAFTSPEFQVEDDIFVYEGDITTSTAPAKTNTPGDPQKIRVQLFEYAELYMHSPYLWGGRSPFGIDCSGFVQLVYKLAGIKLFRDASQQASQGEVISFLDESEPGDLLFFDDQDGSINHVGMLLNRERIIHCSGKVRIDKIDHQGIFNDDLNQYTHQLRLIKRII
jgi:gamma-D-glutamyl-L-lysine dipeptidyl-peptidase